MSWWQWPFFIIGLVVTVGIIVGIPVGLALQYIRRKYYPLVDNHSDTKG